MATYAELRQASENPAFNVQVATACVIRATAILGETTGSALTQRQQWARAALADPVMMGRKIVWGVLGINATATLASIVSATDATVQTAVDTVANVLANYGAN